MEWCRTWLEESYFRPFGLRLISNQALYERDLVVVIYSSLSSHNMWRYVRNRATWLGQQHFRRQCTEQQMENSCQAETFNNFKVTVADKEDFRAELNDCGFSPEGRILLNCILHNILLNYFSNFS